MQRKKEDSKRQRHTQQFLRMVNFCLNLVIDLPELSESYECAMNACMLRCNVAFFFSRLFARRMLKIQSHLTFIHCLFGQMLHRGLDTISRARLPSSLHTHLIYVYHRYYLLLLFNRIDLKPISDILNGGAHTTLKHTIEQWIHLKRNEKKDDVICFVFANKWICTGCPFDLNF